MVKGGLYSPIKRLRYLAYYLTHYLPLLYGFYGKIQGADNLPYEKVGKNEPVCIVNEVPFEIPESWEWVRHNELFQISGGSQPPKSKFISEPQNGYIRPYQIRDYGDNPIPVYIPISTASKISKKGDILLARYGASLGKVFWAEDGAYNVAMARVIPLYKNELIYKEYLFLFYQSNLYQELIHSNSRSAQAGFNKEDLNKLFLPVPPFDEQIRIVDAYKKIQLFVTDYEKKEEILNTLNTDFPTQLKKSILQEAVRGKLVPQDPNDEPAIDLLRRINPSFKPCDNAHYKNLPFEIPESWVWVKHNDILEISGGAQPAKSYFSSVQLPNYIRLYQIRDYGDTPIPVYIPIELASKQTRKGDILLARYGGSLGKVFIAEDGAYNVAMAKIIFRYEQPINKDYVYYYYLSDIYQNKLKEISRTAQAGFNSNDFNEMFFPLPPINEQKRVVLEIKKYSELLDNIIAEL